MDGKKRLSGAEYRKRAREKDDKQKDVIKKTRTLHNFFEKPSTHTKDCPINTEHKLLSVNASSSAASTDVSSACSGADTSIVLVSGTKEEAGEDNFCEECLHFRAHCSIKYAGRKSAVTLLEWLRAEGLHTIYPNVDIALRMCVYSRQQLFRRKIIFLFAAS